MRVTRHQANSNLYRVFNNNNRKLDKLNSQISAQKVVIDPHDSPHKMNKVLFYNSELSNYKRYIRNINDSKSLLSFSELKVRESLQYVQKIRVLVIQGLNQTYRPRDRFIMATEVNQYLKQMVETANSKFKGMYIFSGLHSSTLPYKVNINKSDSKLDASFIDDIKYLGNNKKIYRQVNKNTFMDINLSGDNVFWASNHTITSSKDASDYLAVSEVLNNKIQFVEINNKKIAIFNGDDIYEISRKINKTNIEVTSKVVGGGKYISLESKNNKKIILRDLYEGKVFKNLGLIRETKDTNNYALNTVIKGKNIFNSIVDIRNAMVDNNIKNMNEGLNSLDNIINNFNLYTARVAAKQIRLDSLVNEISQAELNINKLKSDVQAPDVAKSIMEANNYKLVNDITSKLIVRSQQNSLSNYLD